MPTSVYDRGPLSLRGWASAQRAARDPDWAASVSGSQGGTVDVGVRYVSEGKGPAVVLVHGLGASLSVWGENVGPLARGRAVYAVDLPGHGKSEKPGTLRYDAVAGAHFLVGLMDTLGLGSATLIGNSAGGLIAAVCALTYPRRVDGLVLVDSAGLGREMAWFLRLASLPVLGELMHLPNVRSTAAMMRSIFHQPRQIQEALAEDLMRARNDPRAKRSTLEAARSAISLMGLRSRMLVLHKLRDFLKPLLIVWGEEDRILPVSHARRAARALPHIPVHVIPGCGHWPQMEKAPEFNALVGGFLSEVAVGGSAT